MTNILRKCPTCRERTLGLVTMAHTTSVYHDGIEYPVSISDLEMLACSNCGHQIVPMPSEERLMTALRQRVGLLSPEEIRDGRVQLGLTQETLATELGATANELSRWESGHLIQSRAMDTYLRAFFAVPELRSYLSNTQKSARHGEPTILATVRS